eukprot:scaffold1302_cov245-Pinguiococcus_pyrenoidosus.AAC.11
MTLFVWRSAQVDVIRGRLFVQVVLAEVHGCVRQRQRVYGAVETEDVRSFPLAAFGHAVPCCAVLRRTASPDHTKPRATAQCPLVKASLENEKGRLVATLSSAIGRHHALGLAIGGDPRPFSARELRDSELAGGLPFPALALRKVPEGLSGASWSSN